MGVQCDAVIKNSPANAADARDVALIPGSERSPEGGNGNPLQYSCLGSFMDREAWQATLHGVATSWTQLNTHTYTHIHTEYSLVYTYENLSIYLLMDVCVVSSFGYYKKSYELLDAIFSLLPNLLKEMIVSAPHFTDETHGASERSSNLSKVTQPVVGA